MRLQFCGKPARKRLGGFWKTLPGEIEALGDELIQRPSIEVRALRRAPDRRTRPDHRPVAMFANLVRKVRLSTPVSIPLCLTANLWLVPDIRSMLIPGRPGSSIWGQQFPFGIFGRWGRHRLRAGGEMSGHRERTSSPSGDFRVGRRSYRARGKKIRIPEALSLVHGVDPSISIALVTHPGTKAVAFTGSEHAGRAIFDAAMQRPEPIPAYVEMGSVNPVFVLPGALRERGEAIAQGLAGSVNLGVGQFCTCPGLVFGIDNQGFQNFSQQLAAAFERSQPATMLHPGILSGYEQSLSRVAAVNGVRSKKCAQAGRRRQRRKRRLFSLRRMPQPGLPMRRLRKKCSALAPSWFIANPKKNC